MKNKFQFHFFLDRCFRGEIRTAQSQEWNTSDLTARLAWINWDNLGIEPGRRGVLANLQLSGRPHMQHMGLPPPGLHPGVHPHHHPGYQHHNFPHPTTKPITSKDNPLKNIDLFNKIFN